MKHKKRNLGQAMFVAAGLNALVSQAKQTDADAAKILDGIEFVVGEDKRVSFTCKADADEQAIVKGIRWYTGVAFETKYPASSPHVANSSTHTYVLDDYEPEAFTALLKERAVNDPASAVGRVLEQRLRDTPGMGRF